MLMSSNDMFTDRDLQPLLLAHGLACRNLKFKRAPQKGEISINTVRDKRARETRVHAAIKL